MRAPSHRMFGASSKEMKDFTANQKDLRGTTSVVPSKGDQGCEFHANG